MQLAATTSVTAARMILDAMPCLINVGTYCPFGDPYASDALRDSMGLRSIVPGYAWAPMGLPSA